jgi:hypothetical protein
VRILRPHALAMLLAGMGAQLLDQGRDRRTVARVRPGRERDRPRRERFGERELPGRHEPGSATLDFGSLELALEQADYDGVLGCEYTPLGSTEAGLGWLLRRTLASSG